MTVDYMLLLHTRMHRVLTNHRELSWLLVFVETTPSHITIQEKQEWVVCMIVIWPRAAKHKAF